MRGRKKGFTLVELLATIIILGLLSAVIYVSVTSILNRGNDSYYTSQEDMLILAGREYYADHRSELPDEIGDTSNVTLETLIDQNYIDPIKDRNENDCDFENSGVTVQKITERDYQYYGILVCNGDNYTTDADEANPTIKFNPNKESSQNPINVTMSVTDNVEVASVRYVITKDGETYQDSGYQAYNGDINITLTDLGLYEITGYAIDTSGNMTSRNSGKYSIYRGIDCSEVVFDSSKTASNENITVKITVPDNTYRWELSEKVNGGDYQVVNSYIGSENQNIEFTTEGTYQLRAVVYDEYGNSCESVSDEYAIDKTAPELSVVLKKKNSSSDLNSSSNISNLSDYSNNTWYSGYVVLRGSCSDNTGDCTVSYKVTGASTNTDGFVNGTTRNINAQGTSTVQYVATDEAGNTTTKSFTIKLDRTKPTVSYNIGGGIYPNSSLKICATARDNETIKSIEMQPWKNGKRITLLTESDNQVCYTLSGYGKYTIYTKVWDGASNIQSTTPQNSNKYYYQNYTLKSPKSVTVLNTNYYVCPEDREIPTKEQCKTGEYNTMYVDNVRVTNNTTVSFRVRVHMNNWSNTWEDNQSRTLCIANANNRCVRNLDTFSIASSGWLGTGQTRTLGTYTVNVSSFAAGYYRIIIDGASQKFRFKTSSGMKNTFRVTG